MHILYPKIDEKELLKQVAKGNIPAMLNIIMRNQYVINEKLNKLLKESKNGKTSCKCEE
jgi:hypothetical protein